MRSDGIEAVVGRRCRCLFLGAVFFSSILQFRLSQGLTEVIEPTSANPNPKPREWPHQFHSVLVMNSSSGELQIIDLWYDWPNGRNFNIIRKQLQQQLLYDLEWNNGTSFYYTLDGDDDHCRTIHFEVGILRPNWLDGAEYLGQKRVDGFLCNVWAKADFIYYYEDVITKNPVGWRFYTGREAHVMSFEVGAVLEDSNWQAPDYCFQSKNKSKDDIDPASLYQSPPQALSGSLEGASRGPLALGI